MQALNRWRSLLFLKDTVIHSPAIASTSKTHVAAFHSTRVSHNKWRNKWTSANKTSIPPDERSSQTPAKDYVRYKSRQKRADTKKALKNLLFNSGFSNVSFEETYSETDAMSDADDEDTPKYKDRSKSSHSARHAAKTHHKRMKRKRQREKLRLCLNNDDEGSVFQETFRKRGCTWSYWSFQGPFSQSSTPGFDFKQHASWSHKKQRESDIESEDEPEPEPEPYAAPCIYGTSSERQVLGLPLKGPVSIEDVKNAFRLSALKWHPDKHQGPAQAAAEEKFKLCVDAYNSLCQSLAACVNR